MNDYKDYFRLTLYWKQLPVFSSVSGSSHIGKDCFWHSYCAESTMESLPEHHFTTLGETLGRLSDSPILPGAVAALKHDSKLINAQLGEAVIAQIPAFCATTK